MSITAVIGIQWGDEGKAKIVDVLSEDADYVVRFQGGANAGHTVVAPAGKFIFHLIPTGILHPHTTCVIGNGVVFDPEAFFAELDSLEKKHISTEGRLFVSDRCHIVMPYHRAADAGEEELKDGLSIGTTRRGIGPTYAEKARRRHAIRMSDLMDGAAFPDHLKKAIDGENRAAKTRQKGETFDHGKILKQFENYRERLKPHVKDTVPLLRDAVAAGKRMLLEGAQGVMLDVDFGTYPFVTSSNTSIGGAATGTGIPPRKIDRVIGVSKAYATRVGEGPFPTELSGELGKRLLEVGGEYGSTTGRARRCGWIDLVALRYAIHLADADEIALTKMDVLSGLDKIQVCVAYEIGGSKVTEFPASASVLAKAKPVYETLPGWTENIGGIENTRDLPAAAREFIAYLESALSTPIGLISVGAGREALFSNRRETGGRSGRRG